MLFAGDKYFPFDLTGVQTYPLQTLENSHPIDITIPDVLKLNSGEDISIPCNTSNTEAVTTTWNYKTVRNASSACHSD